MSTKHFIQTETIEIEFEFKKNEFNLLNEIQEIVYSEINPALEKLLDETAYIQDKIITKEYVEFDLGIIPASKWKEELRNRTVEAMRSFLLEHKPMFDVKEYNRSEKTVKKNELPPKETMHSDRESQSFSALIFFIAHGFIPWQYRSISIATLEKFILNKLSISNHHAEKIVYEIATLILFSKISFYRFKEQFSEETINAFETYLANNSKRRSLRTKTKKGFHDSILLKLHQNPNVTFIASIYNWFSTNFEAEFSTNRKQILTCILPFLYKEIEPYKLNSTIQNEFISKLLNDENINSEQKIHLEKSILSELNLKNEMNTAPNINEFFVDNAGLIIMHPYFIPLLKNMKYIDEDNTWVDEQCQMRAPLLIQYLVNGETEMEEGSLILNKFLFGLPFQTPMQRKLILTKSEKTICNDLLKAIINHWTVLKSTSIEGLQNSFFKRSGKLEMSETWQLTIENKGWDILLAQLPWGISIIKTPWMTEPLYVNWT